MHSATAAGREQFLEGQRIELRGTVQGVGFRPWVYRVAREVGISGRVFNHAAGVTIDAFGTGAALQSFLNRLGTTVPPAATIDYLRTDAIPFEAHRGFEIVESDNGGTLRVSIPPDLPTCSDCLGELRNPNDRRHGYPFINCTSCGPRFTIATAAPYDRPNTTMAGFRMCPSCQREYDTPADRRFHAQPNACRDCGPQLRVVSGGGVPIAAPDPIGFVADGLAEGWIVALKGIGGFHLACDATSAAAVTSLRIRKRRDEKPFAVMVRDLDAAREIADLSDVEEALLTSPERPIVLATRRESAPISSAVAPRNPLVGVLLPYSPIHHLLLDRVRRPLVMTSGNVSEEPIAYTDEDALARLAGLADFLLLHNRDIVTRCDDSIARVIAGAPVVLRRSRGYVPRALPIARAVEQLVLACGALRKSAFCLARGQEAWLGPHIGDLDNLDTYRAYCESIARMQRFLDLEPAVIAHDLHPEYLSTTYALARHGATTIAVQHHHAHVASVMAEHGLDEKVIGVAYDGTGLGTDGASWGGEILIADYTGFERVGTFRPILLAGGDASVRHPWRTALALVDDAFGGEAPLDSLPLFRGLEDADVDAVRRMLRERVNTVPAHGVGRYFDAFGALGLNRPSSAYEGQIAFEWNSAADPGERGRYRFAFDTRGSLRMVDLRAATRDAVFEIIGGESPARVSARFHNTIVAATVDLVRCVARVHGHLPVALSGGCFQNRRLAEGVLAGLYPDFRTYVHRNVPPGDGGLALGQAVIAGALANGR